MQKLVSNNISYSLLKAVDDGGPSALVTRTFISNSGIDFGKQLDDFISLEKEEFNKKYLIVQNSITGDLATLAELVAKSDLDVGNPSKLTQDVIISHIIQNDLFKQVKKNETRLLKFDNPEFYTHVNMLRRYSDKVLITPKEYAKLVDCRNSLYNHKSTAKYFNCGDDCEEIYQLEINFEYKDVNIKTILDKLIVNHHDETIQGIDLKSGSVDSYDFMKSFLQYKYYIQGGLYSKAITYWAEKNGLSSYKIEPFKFVFLPSFNYTNPKTFVFSEKWLDASWNGFTTRSGYKYRGIDDLIDLVKWHITNQVFHETKEFYENEEISLDDSFITVKD